MYFWRIGNLKTELAARPLSEREALPYLVASMVVLTAATYIPQAEYTLWDYLTAAWSISLAAVGTIYIYRENGGARGRHFLQRYFAIGWVVGVRWLAILVPVGILFYGALEISGVPVDRTGWQGFLFVAAAETIIYVRIAHHVRDLAHRETAAQEAVTPNGGSM